MKFALFAALAATMLFASECASDGDGCYYRGTRYLSTVESSISVGGAR